MHLRDKTEKAHPMSQEYTLSGSGPATAAPGAALSPPPTNGGGRRGGGGGLMGCVIFHTVQWKSCYIQYIALFSCIFYVLM